jgi:hypothetical protein
LSEPNSLLSRIWPEQCFPRGRIVSIQGIVATILEQELTARGVRSLRHSDCMQIVENLLVRLKELDQELAARTIKQS